MGGGGRGSRPFSQSKLQKKKKKKKSEKELHVDYVRCAPLGPAANRLELMIERCHTSRKGAWDKSIECLVKEGNTLYKEKQAVQEFLRSVDDTCHGSTQITASRIENLLCTGLPCPPHQRYLSSLQPHQSAEASSTTVVLSDQATSGLSFSVPASCHPRCRAVGDTARLVQ